jgi:hypothetical protein
MATPESIAVRFPVQTLPLVADHSNQPTYASILAARIALNSNATTIASSAGGGLHGHLALVMTAVEYLALTGVAFVAPVAPPALDHIAGATAAQIIEDNRLHKSSTSEFQRYHYTDQALRQQLIAATPEVYIQAVKDPLLGFGRVTTLTILTHLRTTYGEITAEDLEANQLTMAADWNPPTPIEDLFEQLRAGEAFAVDGGDPPSEPRLVRLGYSIIRKTGLFEIACREWRYKAPADKTFANLQIHFKQGDRDRQLTTTAGTAGYHGANHVAGPPTPAPQATELAAMRAQIATLTAAMAAASTSHSPPSAIPGTVYTGPNMAATVATAATGTPTYCWTHGSSNNSRHTSATCMNPAENHQAEATLENPMGGSTRVWTEADRRAPR